MLGARQHRIVARLAENERRNALPTVSSPHIPQTQLDAVKGVFILLIVAGHNTILTTKALPGIQGLLYDFHVHAFLILPFVVPSRSLTRKSFADRSVRYLTPYLWFYTLAGLLYWAMGLSSDPAMWPISFVLGGLIGSSQLLDYASGFELFWFLPCLLTVTTLRSLYQQAGPRLRLSLLLASMTSLAFLGGMPQWVKIYQPLGILIALAVMPMALATRWFCIHSVFRSPRRAILPSALVFSAMVYLAWSAESHVNLAALKHPTIADPFLLLLHLVLPIAAFVLAWSTFQTLPRFHLLEICGRHSLIIYLSHSLVFQFLLMVLDKLGLADYPAHASLSLASATYVATVTFSLMVSWAISVVPLASRWITPRGMPLSS